MLTLPIKKKWFDMIKSGEKLEEYREIKPYYDSRLLKNYNINSAYYTDIGYVIFRNGYRKDSPKIKCKCECAIDIGKPEWGAIPGEVYYVLRILSVEEVI